MAVVQIVVKTVKFDIYFSCPPYKEPPRFPRLGDLKSNQIGTITLCCRASYIVRNKYIEDVW